MAAILVDIGSSSSTNASSRSSSCSSSDSGGLGQLQPHEVLRTCNERVLRTLDGCTVGLENREKENMTHGHGAVG